MDLDMKQVLQMMGEMNASLQRLTQSVDGLGERFDGLEGRFDGLEKRFDGLENRLDRKSNRLAMDFVLSEDRLKAKFDAAVEEMKGIYNKTAWAADSAKVSKDKAIAHGPMLLDHEDRIRALEGKRKTRPAA